MRGIVVTMDACAAVILEEAVTRVVERDASNANMTLKVEVLAVVQVLDEDVLDKVEEFDSCTANVTHSAYAFNFRRQRAHC